MILSKTVRHKAKNFRISRFFTKSAIEAMEEACRMGVSERESCEDAISRRAVLNTLDKIDSVLDEDRTLETYKELLVACYNDLPPVTPMHKIGRWIRKPTKNDKGGCVEAKMICTCCGKDNECGRKLNYCPNCGAKMEIEE